MSVFKYPVHSIPKYHGVLRPSDRIVSPDTTLALTGDSVISSSTPGSVHPYSVIAASL
ncbi:hypothetical protein BDW62DRAFT_174154, partial [Aspergillus aurantiobrunneus]